MRLLLSLLAFGALLACDDDPAAPDPSAVAGQYSATSFAVTEGGATTDLLAEGATLSLMLRSDLTTAGTLFVPPDAGGQDDPVDLAGTWSMVGDRVDLDLPADVFLRDMLFRFAGGRLVGDQTFAGARVQLVLERVP